MPSPTEPPHPRRRPGHASIRLQLGDFRLRKVGIPRYDLRDPYYAAVTAPWYAFGLSALALVLLVNLLFAVLYLLRPGAVQNLPPGNLADAFFFSVETMSTVGYGAMVPASFYGHVVATIELLLGLGITAGLTGILFVRLSRPRARILFADRVTVHGEGEGAVLSIRVANGRQVLLVGATASLSAVLLEPGEDGDPPIWHQHHLPLEENQNSLFALTWTVTHRLAAPSPLAGFGAAEFAAGRVRLFLQVAAHDPAIGADVQELREYAPDAVAFGRRYAEAISCDDDGRVLADLTRLGDLHPVPEPLRTAATPRPGSSA